MRNVNNDFAFRPSSVCFENLREKKQSSRDGGTAAEAVPVDEEHARQVLLYAVEVVGYSRRRLVHREPHPTTRRARYIGFYAIAIIELIYSTSTRINYQE